MRYLATFAIPPSANRYWRVYRGSPVLSDEAREYKRQVMLRCKVAGMKPLDGPLELRVAVYRARKVGDLSNRIKVLEDALQGCAYHDDKQISRLVAELHDDKANPRVEVEIVSLGEK